MKKYIISLLSVLLVFSLIINIYFLLSKNTNASTKTNSASQETNKSHNENAKSTEEFKSITVSGTDTIPSANDYDEMIITVSADNFEDIYDIHYETESNEKHQVLTYYFTSKLYDQGWIYIADSADYRFSLTEYKNYVDEYGNVSIIQLSHPYTHMYNETSYEIWYDDQNLESAISQYLPAFENSTGSLKFYSINSLQKYDWDTFNCVRTIMYDNEEHTTYFNTRLKEYPF